MRILRPALIIIYGIIFIALIQAREAAAETTKMTIGRVEEVTIDGPDFHIQAKIDTGAENSSLNADNVHLAQRGKEKWIKFDVTNIDGKTLTFERKIIRFVRIKRKEASTQQRPSIELDVCLAGIMKKVEVNLINRSNFNFQMLIGRSFLMGDFVVDVEQIYTHKPLCDDSKMRTTESEPG